MKPMKSFGLSLMMALIAVLAFTASASALVTSSAGEFPTVSASAEGHVVLDNPIAAISCASSVSGKIESNFSLFASGKLSALSFTGCTNSWHVTVVAAGTLTIYTTGGGNGSVVSNGATVESTRFGVSCRYATSNTGIGTITGGTPATIHIEAAIPFHNGSFLCGEGATTWTGSYKVNSPETLIVEF